MMESFELIYLALYQIRTWVQGRVNNLLGRPQIRRHDGDLVLLVGRDQSLGLLQARGRGQQCAE